MKAILLISFLLVSRAYAIPNLVLGLGESQKLPLKGAASVWIENRSLVKAEAVGGQLVLQGIKVGESLFRLRGETRRIQILSPAQMESYSGLRAAIRDIVGLDTAVAKGRLLLKGRLYRLADWRKLAAKNLRYEMHGSLSPELQTKARDFFIEQMKLFHLPPQNVIFSRPIEVRINPKSIYREKYENLLEPFGISVITDENALQAAPTIKVQITIAEVSHKFSQTYGIMWPQQYSATVLPSGQGIWSQIEVGAKALEQNGDVKILASPNIVCLSGKEAEFMAGGEFPIKIINYKIQDIIWKKYGIFLKVKPLADPSGRMSISVDTEISTLNDDKAVDGIPAIETNHVSSHFDLLRPATIALSGLLKNESGSNSEGLPLLSRVPILGPLFASKNFREQKSELIVFVRPTLLDEEAKETRSNNEHLESL